MPHVSYIVGRRLPGVGGVHGFGSTTQAEPAYGSWYTALVAAASIPVAPIVAPAAAAYAVATRGSSSSASSLVGDYVGSGGYSYRYSSDGSITILVSPRGGAGKVIVPGAAGYDAIKAELVRLAASGGRQPTGALSGGGGALPQSSNVWVPTVPGVSVAPQTGITSLPPSAPAPSRLSLTNIVLVGGGIAVVTGLIAWAATGRLGRA